MKSDLYLWNTEETTDSIHSCFRKEISRISKSVSNLNKYQFDGSRPPSEIVRRRIDDEFRTRNWDLSVLVAPRFPQSIPRQNVTIDWCTTTRQSGCDSRHLLSIEICFDNRQAIGTNLLKMELANREFERSAPGETLGLLIVADRQTLRDGRWDNSAGSAEEYEVALTSAYSELITTPIGLLVLRFD